MGGCQAKSSHLIVPSGSHRQRSSRPKEKDYVGKFVYRLLQRSPHRLSLPDMYLGDKHQMRSVARLIGDHEKLQYLDLSNHSIVDKGATDLCRVLSRHQGLTYLDLSCNSIGKQGAVALARMLNKNRSLKTLKLHENCIGTGLHEVTRVIGERQSIRELWLSELDYSALKSLVRSRNTALEAFGMVRTSLNADISKGITTLFSGCPNLVQFSLVYCEIPQCVLEDLENGITQTQTLRKLFIGFCTVEDTNALVRSLVRVLESTTSIVDFGISLSPIAVTLFSRLCDTLVSHGGITALRLVNCGLNEESIRLLTEALARPGLQSIKVLDVSLNRAPSEQMCLLIQAVCRHTLSLETFKLGHNLLDLPCCVQLAKLLRQNRKEFKTLHIQHCFRYSTTSSSNLQQITENLGMALVWNRHLKKLRTSLKLVDQMKIVQFILQRGILERAAIVLEPAVLKRPGIRAVLKAWKRATLNNEALVDFPTFIYAMRDASRAKAWISTVGKAA